MCGCQHHQRPPATTRRPPTTPATAPERRWLSGRHERHVLVRGCRPRPSPGDSRHHRRPSPTSPAARPHPPRWQSRMTARAAHRRDRPPPPASEHRAAGDGAAVSLTSRDDEAVFHEPRVHALQAKLRRSKQRFEPAADDAQRAVRHERRAREHAHDQIIAEPSRAVGGSSTPRRKLRAANGTAVVEVIVAWLASARRSAAPRPRLRGTWRPSACCAARAIESAAQLGERGAGLHHFEQGRIEGPELACQQATQRTG